MAGYSENRGQSLDYKVLKKALLPVDSRVQLPECLQGQALLHKLEGIEQEVPTEMKVRELVLPRRPSARSWITYAAAFLLVVGLFYGLGFHRDDNTALGGVPLVGQDELDNLVPGGGIGTTPPVSPPPVRATQDVASVEPYAGTGDAPANPPANIPDNTHTSGNQAQPTQGQGFAAEIDGLDELVTPMGGAGLGTRLGQFGDFVLAYRPNDPNDPAQSENAPSVLLLLDAYEQEIISQVNIPYMTSISAFHADGYILALVGTSEDATHIYSIDYSDAHSPATLLSLQAPGTLSDENFFDGFLYVASHCVQPCDNADIILENSAEQGTTTIILVNISEGTISQTGVQGAGSVVQLYRTGANIFYTANTGDEYEEYQEWIARLDIVPGLMLMTLSGAEPTA